MVSLSIIIPYHNRRGTIDRCLASINAASDENVEIIIVDDCSEDPLGGYGDPSIRTIRLDSNMGPVAARSFGASIAKSDFLMFLDSDDELLPNWYASLGEVIGARTGCDVYGFPDEKFERGIDFCISSLDEYWRWVPRPERASDYLLVIRASFYRQVVMPKYRISEIWYIVQLFEYGGRAYFSEKALFRYNQDSGNQLSRVKGWKFDASAYARESLCYSIKIFKRNGLQIKKNSRSFYRAWIRRFFKECCLSVNIRGLLSLVLAGKRRGE